MKRIVSVFLALMLMFSVACAEFAGMSDSEAMDAIFETAPNTMKIWSNEYPFISDGIAFYTINASGDYANLRQVGREAAWVSLHLFENVFKIKGVNSCTISICLPYTNNFGNQSFAMAASVTMKKSTFEKYNFEYFNQHVYASVKDVYKSFDSYYVDSSIEKEWFKP